MSKCIDPDCTSGVQVLLSGDFCIYCLARLAEKERGDVPMDKSFGQFASTIRAEGRVEAWSSDKEDMVNHPEHYKHYPMEVKDIISHLLDLWKSDLTPYEAYCLGNELKYRLRAGFKDKDKVQEDIEKALFYNKERLDSDTE